MGSPAVPVAPSRRPQWTFLTNVDPLESSALCPRTLQTYIAQSHVSSRWQQNGRPIPLCLEFLRSIIVEFARLESFGIKHGFIEPEHINIDDDDRLKFVNIPPPTYVRRKIISTDLTLKEVFQGRVVIALLGDPDKYGGEEYMHFVTIITSMKLFKNLRYHPWIQSSMEKFYFPIDARIWLDNQGLCREWRHDWRNKFNKDRPYYKYTMEELKRVIRAYSECFLNVILDMERKKQEKEEKKIDEMGVEQYEAYRTKKKKQKNTVDVVIIFNIVRNITIHIIEQLMRTEEKVMTQLQVLEALQALFPGFLLDLYDFLVRIDNANLDFLCCRPHH